jgi:hypothetical protein
LLRNILIVSAVPGNWCSPDQSTPILLVSSAYRFLSPSSLCFGRASRSIMVGLGYAYHRSRRGRPLGNQYVRKHDSTASSATYIKLVNKSVNTGLIASQVFGSSHFGQSSLVRSQRPYRLQKALVVRCTSRHCAKEPGGSMEGTDKQHSTWWGVSSSWRFGGTLLAEDGVIEMPSVGL